MLTAIRSLRVAHTPAHRAPAAGAPNHGFRRQHALAFRAKRKPTSPSAPGLANARILVRMRRSLICPVLAIGVALTCASTAVAQTAGLPGCPASDEVITTYVPDFLRIGDALAFTIERENAQAVQQVRVSRTGADGPEAELVSFSEGRSRVRIIRSVPREIRSVDLAFSWDQNVGRTNACTGSDSYRTIPVVATGAVVGRADVARLSGRYRATYRGSSPARWRLRPRCDVFGCKTRLRSTGRLRGTLVPKENGGYVLNRRQRAGDCRVGFIDGSSETYGIYLYTRLTLSVARRAADGRLAVKLVGRRVSWYDAPADELNLCNTASQRQVDKLRVRRSPGRPSSSI